MLQLSKPMVGQEEADAVKKVLDSGWLAEGKVTTQFEKVVAKYVGAKYAVATCNCTVALELCLRALKVKDDVVVPAFGHPATVRAIINAECSPELCDVELTTYNIAHNFLTTTNTIMPISWGGYPQEFPYGLIVEDAACSLGSAIGNKKTGSRWVTCFSFHPRKLITTGEGGMIVTNSKELATELRRLKDFGYSNYKFDDVRAAIGLEQMKKIDRIIEKRIQRATVYNELLAGFSSVSTPTQHNNTVHTYQTYAIYLKNGHRNRVISLLAEKGIETQVGAYALHLLSQYKHVKRVGVLTNSELLHHNLLALPMAYDLTVEDQSWVVEELKQSLS